jgi:Ca2+-binding EF-hand superfamily protein
VSTDEEFTEFLRSLPRAVPPAEVERMVAVRDAEQGLYVPHGGEVHHYADESRH